ncbi:MAG: acyl carrier protein [Clostridium sp.]|nr:acyl carrier protein [Clostridium sp.]
MSNINVTGETKIFDELGISSINFVVMIAEIEDKFNITINLEDVDVLKLNQIKSIVELVEKTLEIEKAED